MTRHGPPGRHDGWGDPPSRARQAGGGGVTEILSCNPKWRNNADLIADVAAMGWLDGLVLDATYGKGNFWTKWRPPLLEDPEFGKLTPGLWANDPETKIPSSADMKTFSWDARSLPAGYEDFFDAVVFDPPYKLNGRAGSVQSDSAYGVDRQATYDERMDLILNGSVECARVTKPGGWLHIKAQNQICGGRYIDMTRLIKDQLKGFAMVELRTQWMLVVTPRPQPPGRPQRNPRNNVSTLLSFKVTA